MKIASLLLTLALVSDLLVEASLINPPKHQSNSRLLPRRRKKKPPAKPAGGWAKYFHEPGGSELANHYDSRYEHGILSYEEKQDTQVHLMRAYLDFFKKNNLETWLAHGTLLGWWWNGKVWPRPEIRRVPGLITGIDASMGLGYRHTDFRTHSHVPWKTLQRLNIRL